MFQKRDNKNLTHCIDAILDAPQFDLAVVEQMLRQYAYTTLPGVLCLKSQLPVPFKMQVVILPKCADRSIVFKFLNFGKHKMHVSTLEPISKGLACVSIIRGTTEPDIWQ